jgi:hypothetical protein
LDPADPGLELGRVEEKTGKGKTRCDPARPGQKLGCNPLTFFLLKRCRFIFIVLKKLTRATLSKLEIRVLN